MCSSVPFVAVEKVTTSPFLYLSLDLPPCPLFQVQKFCHASILILIVEYGSKFFESGEKVKNSFFEAKHSVVTLEMKTDRIFVPTHRWAWM